MIPGWYSFVNTYNWSNGSYIASFMRLHVYVFNEKRIVGLSHLAHFFPFPPIYLDSVSFFVKERGRRQQQRLDSSIFGSLPLTPVMLQRQICDKYVSVALAPHQKATT